MVGKFSFSGIRHKLHNQTHQHERGMSDASSDYSGNTKVQDIKRHIPFIASPLDPKTQEWLARKKEVNNITLRRRPTVAQQEANRVAGGIFRKQHEASPLELFFDLFFVANLAVYVYNHVHVTPEAVGNFIGFFSLMWSYWFHVSIHDVRFYVDSILNRFFKLCSFAIFVSFTGLGPIYSASSTSKDEGERQAYRGLALVFMLSRLILVVQHGVVWWFVRPFKKTILPLSLMMLIYLCSAMAFLGTYIEAGNRNIMGLQAVRHLVIWYVIIGVEVLLVVGVSTIWRILSFKRTHLVERVGLLTLIIMGEGIIGIIKAISYIMGGTSIDVWSAVGRVIPGVFFVYLIFVLYFTPIAHDRFGTIRQQVWVLLHYPLHVAILLAQEGSAQTTLWATVISSRERLIGAFPSLVEPSNGFSTVANLTNRINTTLTQATYQYTYYSLPGIYNWTSDLNSIRNLTQTYEYASPEFNERASNIMGLMINKTTNFFFSNFKFEGPYPLPTETNAKLLAYYGGYQVIFTYFYICSGCLLLCLAAMYWVGKNDKTWEEWWAIVPRTIVGVALPFITIAGYVQPYETGYMFADAGWLVPVVVFCYLFVIIMDNLVQNLYDRRFIRKLSMGEIENGTLEDLHKRRFNGAFGPHAPATPDQSTTNLANTVTHQEKAAMMMNNNQQPQYPSNIPQDVLPRNKTIRFDERTRSNSTSIQPGESNSLVSGDATLAGHRDSEQFPRPSYSDYPSNSHGTVNGGTWGQNQAYNLPPIGQTNTGYGRMETEYQGYDGRMHSLDVERGQAYQNDESFEREAMMSPATLTDLNIDRPPEGYHRPEDQREH